MSKNNGVTRMIESPAELRRMLLDGIVAVAEGRMNVAQANAIVGLSTEVHKSIRQQWDMTVYAAEKMLGGGDPQPVPAGREVGAGAGAD